MPPAARPSVSVKIRLKTSPIPTDWMMISRAASVCIFFPSIGEVGDNFLAEADDIPDPDDKRMRVRFGEHVLEDIFRRCVHQIRNHRGGEPQGDRSMLQRQRELAGENKMLRGNTAA